MKDDSRRQLNIMYEVSINLVAVFIVMNTVMKFFGHTLFEQTNAYIFVEWGIYIIFAVDYFVRLIASQNKKSYFKKNIFELLAILPFSSTFRIFRIVRAFKLVKRSKFKRFINKMKQFVNTNSFCYVLYGTVVILLIGGWGLYKFEHGNDIHSLWDGIWMAFVTITTVGYGDYVPVTIGGRITAMILMIIGIGFLGMLTGTISTFFLNRRKIHGENVREKYVDLSEFNDREVEEILNFVEYMRGKKV